MAKATDETFNGLSGKEWTLLSKNVWDDVSSPREAYQIEHGSTFPLALAERVIRLYSKEGDLVFDPFVGVGTTVIAAAKMERDAIGIELQKKFCDTAKRILDEEKTDLFGQKRSRQAVVCDDCRNLLEYVDRDSVQVTLTSAPYANFSRRDRSRVYKRAISPASDANAKPGAFSIFSEDFGNLGYEEYTEELKKIFKKVFDVTKPGGYCVWVVKDYRDTQSGIPYVSVHSDITNFGVSAGWLHHDLIIWDQNDQRRLMLLGFPNVFYSNQNCAFLVVFRKPERVTA
ncbi:MAG: site-specific DNA-methyltransferase [Candidatus Omnitrophica bacterium]|nr:site-specific DNA-methyltransferase [Candidatus Omnitrophota bacterium]